MIPESLNDIPSDSEESSSEEGEGEESEQENEEGDFNFQKETLKKDI